MHVRAPDIRSLSSLKLRLRMDAVGGLSKSGEKTCRVSRTVTFDFLLQRTSLLAGSIFQVQARPFSWRDILDTRKGGIPIWNSEDDRALSGLPYVVNVTLPDTPANYIHRIGRVGRADKMGLAISLVATCKERVWYLQPNNSCSGKLTVKCLFHCHDRHGKCSLQ